MASPSSQRQHSALVLVACVAAAAAVEEQTSWPASLDFLQTGSDVEFHAFVAPLANMTKLTYTATWGSYYEEAATNATVPGWQRGALQSNPKAGGMRALTFLQAASRRGVVAFRGTDLNTSCVSGQADQCADAVLGAGPPLPGCEQFSAWTLDYLARALGFAEAAAQRNPDVDWLYTGHSLGALLAEVVAAVRGKRALGFAAPAVAPVLRNRTQVDPAAIGAWATAALYNQWDPLRYQARGQLVGAECYWSIAPAPAGCGPCDLGGGTPDLATPACRQCFAETHVYARYLDLVASGRRPTCQPVAEDALLPDLLV